MNEYKITTQTSKNKNGNVTRAYRCRYGKDYKSNVLIIKKNIKSLGIIHHTILLKDIQNSWKRKKSPTLSKKIHIWQKISLYSLFLKLFKTIGGLPYTGTFQLAEKLTISQLWILQNAFKCQKRHTKPNICFWFTSPQKKV